MRFHNQRVERCSSTDNPVLDVRNIDQKLKHIIYLRYLIVPLIALQVVSIVLKFHCKCPLHTVYP
jgi:hypothetical protein